MIDIELAGFRAWPAAEEINDRGIVLRRSAGYTKRANSANLIQSLQGDFSARVRECEQYFEHNKLPCIFRLPAFCDHSRFDEYLDSLAYRLVDRSFVLTRTLSEGVEIPVSDNITLEHLHVREWLEHFYRLSNNSLDKQGAHIEILERISDPVCPMVLLRDGSPVACGLGVLSDNVFGVFDLVTGQQWRNKGYGAALVKSLLAWAREQGADRSYLQVVAKNQSALKLYESLGYKLAYEYWYRVK